MHQNFQRHVILFRDCNGHQILHIPQRAPPKKVLWIKVHVVRVVIIMLVIVIIIVFVHPRVHLMVLRGRNTMVSRRFRARSISVKGRKKNPSESTWWIIPLSSESSASGTLF